MKIIISKARLKGMVKKRYVEHDKMKNNKRPNYACCQKPATPKPKKLTHHLHRLAAVATVGMLCGTGRTAEAAGSSTTFRDMAGNIVNSVSGGTSLISALCWIGGAGLGVAGIFKLKNHVDNPGQTPMKDGLIRLGCGGGLLSFPFIMAAMQGSVSNGSLTGINATNVVLDSVSIFAGP